MAKRTSESRKKRRGLRTLDKELYQAMRLTGGEAPTEEQKMELILDMYGTVLRRMVELRIAQYLHTTMIILKEQFGFNEAQLTLFGRQLRRQTDVAKESQDAEQSAAG